MTREPVATTQTRQVRVVVNILTKDDFLPSSFGCADSRSQKIEGSRKVRFSTLKVMAL